MADAPRPDPAQGVFETLLVLDGRPIEPQAHLARLRASLAALYPHRTPPGVDVTEGVASSNAPTEGGPESLRITVAPAGDDNLGALIERRQVATGVFFPHSGTKPPSGAVSLASLSLAGGLGPHKWADRSLLDEVQARLPADTLPLLVDEDGSVMEASRANVFAVRDGALLTPPLDGRILPGVTRMRVLEIAASAGIDSSEAELHRDDFLCADGVFLTGSVRGIEPVRSLDGTELSAGTELTAHLATKLRESWAGAAQVG